MVGRRGSAKKVITDELAYEIGQTIGKLHNAMSIISCPDRYYYDEMFVDKVSDDIRIAYELRHITVWNYRTMQDALSYIRRVVTTSYIMNWKNREEKTMNEKEIREICLANHLQCNIITKLYGSFDKELFFIDDKYLIRTSKQSMLEEQSRINRVKDLKQAPKILYASDQGSKDCNIYYLILQNIPGSELFTNYLNLQEREIREIGIEIANFLHELHKLKGNKYDIGHYIPIIPGYDKPWRSGHEIYWSDIYHSLKNIQLSEAAGHMLELSNDYININISCLDYENGPSLLHNDFHYKNIIIHNNALSGIIDWECSQYGEADFDLIHLLHWCIFPPSKGLDMTLLLTTIFHSYLKKSSIPMLEKRLTIYLLEHDFIQILWSQGKRADELLPRIKWWIENLEKYIQNNLLQEED